MVSLPKGIRTTRQRDTDATWLLSETFMNATYSKFRYCNAGTSTIYLVKVFGCTIMHVASTAVLNKSVVIWLQRHIHAQNSKSVMSICDMSSNINERCKRINLREFTYRTVEVLAYLLWIIRRRKIIQVHDVWLSVFCFLFALPFVFFAMQIAKLWRHNHVRP